MKEFETILVVVHGPDDGEIVIAKAASLARGCGAKLHVARVVYEGFVDLSVHEVDDSQALKSYLMESEEAFLEDLIDGIRGEGLTTSSSVIWHKSQWQGILDEQRESGADLVIKSTNFPVDEVIRTPQDWNLLRHSPVPVMLLKPSAWNNEPTIIAAIDVEEAEQRLLNQRIVRQASETSECLGGHLKLLEAYPSVEHWVGPVTVAIDFNQVRAKVRRKVTDRLASLCSDVGVSPEAMLVEEGEPSEAIEREVQGQQADILVMGTNQRSGVQGMLLGNTSEAILHRVNCDVLVVN